jgi:hypothetical protein
MFWTASTASEAGQHECHRKGKATYELYSRELGRVGITEKLGFPGVVPLNESTYHGTRIYGDIEKTTNDTPKSITHNVSCRFESATFLSLIWACWVALNWTLS